MLTLARNPEPLRLITGAPGPSDASGQFWLFVALSAGVFILSSLGALYLWSRRGLDRDPSEFAFRTLARRLGVRRRDVRQLRALARSKGLPPVALLMSPSALRDAIERAKGESTDRASIERLSRRLMA